MVLHKSHHLFKKVYVRGHRGGSLFQFLPHIGNFVSNIGSNLLSKVNLGSVAKSLGGVAVGSLASYGVNKLLEPTSPPLTSGPIPQGLIHGDILPVMNSVERINPENSAIHLNDGMVKNTVTFKRQQRHAGQGLSHKKEATKSNIDKILNNKSKQLLQGIIHGKGLYTL